MHPPRSGDLTPAQRAVFGLVYETARDRGYQPSIKDLTARLKMRNTRVQGILGDLCDKGYLGPAAGRARRLDILRRPDGAPFDGFADKPSRTLQGARP